MDIPSAHLRQQKLEHQRHLIEQKQRAKRGQAGLKLIQASDLKSESVKTSKSLNRPLSGARREIHGYDGPMVFLNQSNNPDDASAMTTVQVTRALFFCFINFLCGVDLILTICCCHTFGS